MEPAYFEATQNKDNTTFTFYTAEQWGAEQARRRRAKAAEKRRIARQRQFRLFREAVGGLLILMGFAVTIAAGGCECFWEIVTTAGCGVGAIGGGGWLAHAFPGQEKNAEWRRRINRIS